MATKRRRGCLFFLGILVVLGIFFGIAVGLTFMLFDLGGEKGPSKGVLYLNLDTPIQETGGGSLFHLDGAVTIRQIDETMARAADDPDIKGLVLRFTNAGAGIGTIHDLRNAILRFKESGKFVIVYTDFISFWNYFVATAADQIICAPTGWFAALGMRLEPTYFAEALDKIGVTAQVNHVGDYKTAGEQFTRTSMSDAERQTLEALIDDVYTLLTEAMAKSRGMETTALRALVDRAPMSAKSALAEGLVDRLGYADELENIASELAGSEEQLVKWSTYTKSDSPFSLDKYFARKLALVYAEGPIYSGESSDSPWGGNTIGSQTLAKAIKDARENEDIEAIVLRIESPGGSGTASDEIWREVKLTRGAKPIIASIANVAASGGYYIAMACDEIIGQPTSITGSIGVVSSKFVTKGLYDKLGINKEILKRGTNADMMSDYVPFTEEQAALLNSIMEEFYWEFVGKAAEGRDMENDAVHAVAQGRAWTSMRAREVGLINEFGGLWEAIQRAKERAGISADDKVAYEIYPKASGLLAALSMQGATGYDSRLLDLLRMLAVARHWQQDQVLALMPCQVAIQ
ncbi:signal peptide peptidase SppA [bacterium]|nr:signal peptide peptidase SppA [candidate division CSSED10-310 bacterium]